MNETSRNGTQRIWAYIVAIAILFVLGTALSLLHDVSRIREERFQLAISQADFISRTIFAANRWAMEYSTPSLLAARTHQSDSSVEKSSRSTQATGGDKNGEFAKMDHISMMQFMEKILGREGLHVHVVSLEPLYIEEVPDGDWERISYNMIVKGSKQEYTVTGTTDNQVFHYMAPLKVDAGCIRCHGQHKYNIGDVPNVISISFDYFPFEQSARQAKWRETIQHLFSLGAALGILFFLGRRIVGLMQTVQATEQKVRTLEGILPMCMNCHKIRKEGAAAADQAGWIPVADYIRDRSEAEVSHGICPECMQKLYGPGGSLTED